MKTFIEGYEIISENLSYFLMVYTNAVHELV